MWRLILRASDGTRRCLLSRGVLGVSVPLKGNLKVISELNKALREELTAIRRDSITPLKQNSLERYGSVNLVF